MKQITQKTLFEEAGGEEILRKVLRDFYDRVYADTMIGFMFRQADKERLIQKEFELSARFLGAKNIQYSGKPLKDAHSKHRIMGGQFARRVQILKETLLAHQISEKVSQAWLAHQETLRPLITGDTGGNCDPELARQRAISHEKSLSSKKIKS